MLSSLSIERRKGGATQVRVDIMKVMSGYTYVTSYLHEPSNIITAANGPTAVVTAATTPMTKQVDSSDDKTEITRENRRRKGGRRKGTGAWMDGTREERNQRRERVNVSVVNALPWPHVDGDYPGQGKRRRREGERGRRIPERKQTKGTIKRKTRGNFSITNQNVGEEVKES